MERKSLTVKADGVEGDEGTIVATFSTFDVVDSDGDVVRPGAFMEGAEVPIGAWGHNAQQLPVGKGVIRKSGAAAQLDGRFFLDTEHGKAQYLTLKSLGALAEWSYIYIPKKWSRGAFGGRADVRILEEIDVWSVDPVLRGAGIGTGTDEIKSQTLEFGQHGESALAAASAFVERAKGRADYRAKEGRSLSGANRRQLQALLEEMQVTSAELEQLLAETDPEAPKASAELASAYLRYQQIISNIGG